ncbi:2-octaprenyl-6-methoxyphenyl hydroxylase [Haliea sp. E17]|uniref:2-octaprenyl-6-methoxyphenyl hydroxylase n=1 Tax=Haliea sp. E17 TaxID=3401576 RepID=UPI003AAD6B5A
MSEMRDIVIAGGGMVGISLALRLARQLPGERRITLVEGFPLPTDSAQQSAYHPSFDARSTALSYSSQSIFVALGLWDAIARHACPIETIHVSNRGRFGSALLRAADYGWPALGYVVENPWLGRCLASALRASEVEILSPATVETARVIPAGQKLALSGEGPESLETRLLVVADGAGSGLRQRLGFSAHEKSYGQQALVGNVAHAQPHGGRAFERFTANGPLALLPLPGVSGAPHRSALVWTVDPERGSRLRDCAQAEFLGELQEAFGYRLGRLQQVGERAHYPLSLVQSAEQVRSGVVVMGNAAHALHPVAGQGFNLALRAVAVLADTLAEALEQGESCGDLAVLERYERRQRGDQRRTIAFSDSLPGLFSHPGPLLGLTRDLSLAGLDILPALKREFVRHTAGVAALGE